MSCVHSASAANRTPDIRPIECLVDDLADGAGATSTLGATAKAAIDMTRGAARHRPRGGSHIVIAQHVAGTDDHRKPSIRIQIMDATSLNVPLRQVKIKTLSKGVLNYHLAAVFLVKLFSRAKRRLLNPATDFS